MAGHQSDTSLTLLGQLRAQPANQAAWRKFVARYGPRIENWCRGWGLQPADAQDVTQNVLAAMVKQMATFEYDPSGRFRSWLKTVAYRAWCVFQQQRQKKARASGDSAVRELLESVPAREDFVQQLEVECDREILDVAIQCVRERVADHTWEAYRLAAMQGLSGEEVAVRLQMKVGAVYVARSKVNKMLQQEIQRLEETEESSLAVRSTRPH
jgi:RNA polymerase sigma-70 factor (ECF subfamily)